MPTAKQLAAADRAVDATDWSRFDGMSDDEIRAAWAWDADATWPTEGELKDFRLVQGAEPTPKDAAA